MISLFLLPQKTILNWKIFMQLPEKYNYDIYVLSVTYDFYRNDSIIDHPKIVILCNKWVGETDTYIHFKLNFMHPSNYYINLNTPKIDEQELVKSKTYC